MSASYICRQCRYSLLQHVRPTQVAPSTARPFVSLAKRQGTRSAPSQRDEVHDTSHDAADEQPRSDPAWGSMTTKPTPEDSKSGGRHLVNLFREAADPTPQAKKRGAESNLRAVELYNALEQLRNMVEDRNLPVSEVWSFFVSNVGPEVWITEEAHVERPALYLPTVKKVLKRIREARSPQSLDVTVPSLKEVFAVCTQLDAIQLDDWRKDTWAVLIQLGAAKEVAQAQSPTSELQAADIRALEERLVDDVLEAWQFLLTHFGNHQTRRPSLTKESVLATWRGLPPAFRRAWADGARPSEFIACIMTLLPRYPKAALPSKTIAQITLTTFALLSNHASPSAERAEACEELVLLLSRVVSRTDVASLDVILGDTTENLPSVVIDYVKGPWLSVIQCAKSLDPSLQPQSARIALAGQAPVRQRADNLGRTITSPPQGAGSALLHRRLKHAFEKKRVTQAIQLFDNLQQLEVEELNIELCNYFISVYMALRLPDRAIDVWNFILKNNLNPGNSTWNSMLEGCKISRNTDAVEVLWKRMLETGLKPDAICWTTRISALAESGHPGLAIQAIEDMGNQWRKAARRKHPGKPIKDLLHLQDVDGVAKPTVEAVNATILGLLRRQDFDKTHAVLAWADGYGVQPDLVTFNTLLRPLIRSGKLKETSALLELMSTRDIRPDIVTFTTILDETFRDAESFTPDDQVSILDFLFAEMDTAGFKPNLHTYGKIIYALLQSRSNDMTAVNMVLARMAAQRLEPSQYIYTNLVSHYFAQDPPNLQAIDALFQRIERSAPSLDHIFWDRAIEGYASLGDTASALRIVAKFDTPLCRAGWPALRLLLLALRENNEWDLMRELVKNIAADRGSPLPTHEKGQKGQHAFWETAAEYGLAP